MPPAQVVLEAYANSASVGGGFEDADGAVCCWGLGSESEMLDGDRFHCSTQDASDPPGNGIIGSDYARCWAAVKVIRPYRVRLSLEITACMLQPSPMYPRNWSEGPLTRDKR